MRADRYDFIVIGSGFGGGVSALRLAERGYSVLVLEKGRRFRDEDFPETNWDVRRWYWQPALGLTGMFEMTFLEHVTVLHGVGVGGGSLGYANVLMEPHEGFFDTGPWAGLADWRAELAPHFATAKRMLGVATNPRAFRGDEAVAEVARGLGREGEARSVEVGVYFGEPGVRVPDPYFDGEGPDRWGCKHCGACMTGCRWGAKNTIDRNYLHLAERRGARVAAETEVTAVRPAGGGGYRVETRASLGERKERRAFHADQVVFAGGVMGTVPLLLRMRDDPEGLPGLSARIGDGLRTNDEDLIVVVAPDASADLSEGVAITSTLTTDDEGSTLQPVRYGKGSGFFRLFGLPYAPGASFAARVAFALRSIGRDPVRWVRAQWTPSFATHAQFLLFMGRADTALSLRLARSLRARLAGGIVSRVHDPARAPRVFTPERTRLADSFAAAVGGVPMGIASEMLLGAPTTAHVLGGACIGRSAADGVVDSAHRVFGYAGLYVVDGSVVGANPGINPALTIVALAERAMGFIPFKG